MRTFIKEKTMNSSYIETNKQTKSQLLMSSEKKISLRYSQIKAVLHTARQT